MKSGLIHLSISLLALALTLAAGCARRPPSAVAWRPAGGATHRPYRVNGHTYYPLPSAHGFVETGYASWYGREFHGRRTASGEIYNMYAMTAAHKVLPMNTYVLVTNLENGRRAVVRINDRGPFVKNRIIDLSYAAAKRLGIVGPGTARVRIEALGEARPGPGGALRFVRYPDLTHGTYFVQLGAFENRDNAYRFQHRLARRWHTVVITHRWYQGIRLYRVQVYAGTSYAQAKRFEAYLEAHGHPDAFVVAR